MKEKIASRFQELIHESTQFMRSGDEEIYIEGRLEPACHAWLDSVANLLQLVALKQSHYFTESKQVMSEKAKYPLIQNSTVKRMFGLLTSAKIEWDRGLLVEIEYVVAAATFDDFLDHAATYHKANKKTEAAVLVSAVLEDTIKKIALKNGVIHKGMSLESIIDELVKANIFTTVKAKRVKAYSGTRNHAMHAEWNDFDIKDVGEMIKGVKELIEEFL